MLDENEAPDQDTADTEVVDAPEVTETTDTAEDTSASVNWEERYKQLQADHTRKSQRLKELEGPAAELYGQDGDEDTLEFVDEDEFEDPVEQRLERMEQLLGERFEREQEQQFVQKEHQYIASQVDAVAKAMDEEFSPAEDQAIGRLAQTMRDEHGAPDVAGAAKLIFDDILKSRRKMWAQTKRSAPRPGQGGVAVDKIDPTDQKQRQALLSQRIEEADAGV